MPLNNLKTNWRFAWNSSPAMIITILLLTTVACVLIEAPTANKHIARLPTLTVTSLPMITPTPNSANPAPAETSTTESANATPLPLPANTGDEATEANNVATPLPAATNSVADTPATSTPAVDSAQITPPTATPPPTPLPTETSVTPPTLTPTPSSIPSSSPVPTSTEVAATSTPTTQPVSGSPGWALTHIQLYPDQNGKLRLYGDMTNETDIVQELIFINGTFYDAQGQVIAAPDQTSSYWPVDAVPAGGQLPFTLTIDNIQDAATYNIEVESQATDYLLHQDFEFSEVTQWQQDSNYCVSGKFRNQGATLQYYAALFMVLYNDQDQVINFADYYSEESLNDQALDFEICGEPANQTVSRYELRAWGE